MSPENESKPGRPSGEAKVVYEHSIEGMYLKGHPQALTPHVKAALKAAGIDLDARLKSVYPAEVVHEATRVFRRLAYAHEPDDTKAYKAMGVATVDGYFNTVMGKAATAVLRLVGFKRLIDRLPQAMSGGSNYTFVNVAWKGPTEAHVLVSDVQPHPAINLGVLERGLGHWFKGKDVAVTLLEHQPPGATYRITFREF